MRILLSVLLLAPFAVRAQTHAERAMEFIQKGDLKGAENELRKAVSQAPDDPGLLTSLGGVLGMEGDPQHANPYLKKAVELDPGNPALRRNLAANQWQLKKFSEARSNLERLISADRNDKAAVYLLGMVSADQKEYRHSATLLESVPEVLERQPQGWVALGSSYYHTDRPDQARSALRNLFRAPQSPDLTFAGAQAALEANDYATAESLFASIRSTYSDPAAVDFQIALAQCREHRTAECRNTLLESLKTGHASPDSYALLCTLLAGDGASLRALDIATQGTGKYPDAYRVWSSRQALEMKLQYYSKAADSAMKAFALHKSPDTLRDLATAEWRSGLREQAIAHFDQALAQYPGDAATREAYGVLLLDEGSAQNRARALAMLKQAVALDASSSEALYQLANAELQNNQPALALQYLQRVVRERSDDSRVHYALSRAYRHLGRSADAESEMDSYQKLKNQAR